MSLYSFPFDSTETPQHERLGGKCTSLVIMTNAGMPVPPGFAVTTDAFDAVMNDTRLHDQIAKHLKDLNYDNPAELDRQSALIRELILTQEVPDAVRHEVVGAYRALMELCGGEVPVAVRSSATAEDLPDASFAGQQDTGLAQQVDSGRHCARLCRARRPGGLCAGDRQRLLPAPGPGAVCAHAGTARQSRTYPGPQRLVAGHQRGGAQHLGDPGRCGCQPGQTDGTCAAARDAAGRTEQKAG